MAQLDYQMATVFNALGDPARIEMVRRLAGGQPSPISSVSNGLGITRQGARKHLQVLVDAKMVSLEPKGRDVLVSLTPETLDTAKAFIAEIERRWDMRLEALRRFVEEEPAKPPKTKAKAKKAQIGPVGRNPLLGKRQAVLLSAEESVGVGTSSGAKLADSSKKIEKRGCFSLQIAALDKKHP